MTRKDNAMIQNIQFYCCSDVAMAVDMAEPLVKELNKLEKYGVEAYDVILQQEIIVVSYCITCNLYFGR